MREKLRTVRLSPYRRGAGPSFVLQTWSTADRDYRGQTRIADQLREVNAAARSSRLLFAGADFSGSPLHADDSDATIAALLSFLTLRPGDTDRDYFAQYTPMQLAYCDAHAEALSEEASARFGDA